MGMTKQRQRAVAISAFDLPDSGQLLVHGCEDCACAVSATHAVRPGQPLDESSLGGHWVRANDACELDVRDDYWVVFNPAGDGGAVVLNGVARQVLRCFGSPATLAEVRAAIP